MGYAIESVLGYNNNLTGSTTFDNLNAGAGQSFTIRSYVDGSAATIDDIWASDDDSAAQLSIRSPRMHDTTKGILFAWTNQAVGGGRSNVPSNLMPGFLQQRVYSTDILTLQANGTAADVVCSLMNVRYQNLGGVNGRFASWNQIQGGYDNEVGILVQPGVNTGTVGQWGTGVALNSVDDRLHADTDYALLGWSTSIPCTAVGISGIDVGNLIVGGPGGFTGELTGDFFIQQSVRYGNVPYIPVFNSNNKQSIFVQIADVAPTNTVNVTLTFAQLRNKFQAAL